MDGALQVAIPFEKVPWQLLSSHGWSVGAQAGGDADADEVVLVPEEGGPEDNDVTEVMLVLKVVHTGYSHIVSATRKFPGIREMYQIDVSGNQDP